MALRFALHALWAAGAAAGGAQIARELVGGAGAIAGLAEAPEVQRMAAKLEAFLTYCENYAVVVMVAEYLPRLMY